MTWLHRYQLKRACRRSLWLWPVLAIGLVLVVAPLLRRLDRVTGWSWFNFTPDGAHAILGAFTASMLTLAAVAQNSRLVTKAVLAQCAIRGLAPTYN